MRLIRARRLCEALMERLIYEQVYIDTNIFIAAVEGFDGKALDVLSLGERGEIFLNTSTLTLTELLAKPDRAGKYGERYREMFGSSEALTVHDVTQEIATKAAQLIGRSSLELPDVLHCATAKVADCEFMLTNDITIQHASGIETYALEDLEAFGEDAA